MISLRRIRPVDADRIPVAPSLPVLEDGRYVWPLPRRIGNTAYPAGAPFYTEGDCRSCPRCGRGNSTIAAYCAGCRSLLVPA